MPVCPTCGTHCSDDHKFCSNCGARLIKPEPSENTSQTDRADWQERYRQYRPEYGQQYSQYRQDAPFTVPEADTAPDDGGKAVSIVSMVLGIAGFLLFFSPLFAIPGLITGIVGLRKSGRATAKIGIILSAVSISLFLTAFIIAAVNGFDFSALDPRNLINMLGSFY